MKRAEKVNHLVRTAADLFNRLGYHAAGIDRIIEESGIAKTTLYRHFESKEELIVAVLRQMDEDFRRAMRDYVAEAHTDPCQRLLATFDFLEQWFSNSQFHGCPFVSAAGEYGERSSPVHQESVLHKRLMIAYFEELARAADLDKAEQVAERINLLHEGATAVAHIFNRPVVAGTAKRAAAELIGL